MKLARVQRPHLQHMAGWSGGRTVTVTVLASVSVLVIRVPWWLVGAFNTDSTSPGDRTEVHWSYAALAGDAAVVVGQRVVEVAAGGGAAAAGTGAGGCAGPDQPLQGGAGVVAWLLVAVVAVAGGEGVAVGIGEDDLPAGGAVPGEGAGQQAGGVGVQRAVAGRLAGLVGQVEQGGQRERQVDQAGHWRQPGHRVRAAQPGGQVLALGDGLAVRAAGRGVRGGLAVRVSVTVRGGLAVRAGLAVGGGGAGRAAGRAVRGGGVLG